MKSSKRAPRRVPGRVPQRTELKPVRVRATGPADLLALVPYLLGFRPTESLVLLLIRQGQVLLTARIDLPPEELQAAVTDQFAALAGQHEAEGLVLVGFSEHDEATRSLLRAMVPQLGPHGLIDAVYADGRRWWSMTCTKACCPVEGTRYDTSSSPLAAEAVYAGMASAPGRDAIEARVSGPAAAEVDLLSRQAKDAARELGEWSERRRAREMSSLVTAFVAGPRAMSDAECARLAVLAADVAVRDVAWALIERADVDHHLDLWGQVVSRTVSPWEPAPLCLLGMAAWIAGNGALQNCCSERARRIDPGYSLVSLLDEINQRALSPSFWDVLGATLKSEIIR
ncbi:MAG TPA: DUF4192 domain-containing protein [Propionibacteriaceae bacterium]|nr:DUF4192 domain-containing protein [Propionibacteriaceae bacterium]